MKFFFCEKCGKRVTDDEIAEGQGKNKKLAGVFCTDCSVGVMTLETIPLTDHDAQALLQGEGTPPPRPASASPKRGSSGIRLPLNAKRPGSRLRAGVGSDRHAPLDRKNDRRTERTAASEHNAASLWIGVAAGVVLAFGLGLWFATGKSRPERRSAETARTTEPEALSQPPAKQTSAPTPPPARAVPDRRMPTPPETKPDPAAVAWRALQKDLKELGDDDLLSRVELTRAFAEAHATSVQAARARVLIKQWEDSLNSQAAEAPKTETSADKEMPKRRAKAAMQAPALSPAKPEPPAVPLKPRPALPPAEAYQQVTDAALEALIAALKDPDPAVLDKAAAQLPPADAWAAWAPARATLASALTVCVAWRKARHKALNAQVGKVVKLDTREGAAPKVKLLAFDGAGFDARTVFVINNETREGKDLRIDLADLSPRGLKQLAPLPQPSTPADWTARALLDWSAAQFEGVDAALAKLDDQPVRDVLDWKLTRERWQRREADTKAAYNAWCAKADGKLSEAQAKQLLADFDAWKTAGADTAFLYDHEKEAAARRESVALVAEQWDRKLAGLFKGEVVAADFRKRFAHVKWDLVEHKEHIGDFHLPTMPYGDKSRVYHRANEGLYIPCTHPNGQFVYLKAFHARQLELTVEYRFSNAEKMPKVRSASNFMGVWFGINKTGVNQQCIEETLVFKNTGVAKFQNMMCARNTKTFQEAKIVLPEHGTLTFVITPGHAKAAIDGKHILDTPFDPADAPFLRGISFGGGFLAAYCLRRVEAKGTLDETWLETRLGADLPAAPAAGPDTSAK